MFSKVVSTLLEILARRAPGPGAGRRGQKRVSTLLEIPGAGRRTYVALLGG